MTQNDLREKVINAEAKVAKRKAVLKKHREQLAKLIQKGADEFDTYITKHDIDDLVTVVRIIREEAPAWQH